MAKVINMPVRIELENMETGKKMFVRPSVIAEMLKDRGLADRIISEGQARVSQAVWDVLVQKQLEVNNDG